MQDVGVVPQQSMHAQELDAYKKVVRCFMQGPYDLSKEEALATLRQVLRISNDAHLRVRRELKEELRGDALQIMAGAGTPLGLAVSQGQPPLHQHPLEQSEGGAGFRGPGGSAAAAHPSPSSPYFALSSHHPSPFTPTHAARQQGAKPSRAAGRAAGSTARKRLKGTPTVTPSIQGGQNLGIQKESPQHQIPTPQEIHPLVGRRVLRHWPRDGGWFEGLVSDYNTASGEHCIVYDLGLPTESYEWFRIEGSPPSEFRLADRGGAVDVTALPGLQQTAPKHAQQQQQQQQRVGQQVGQQAQHASPPAAPSQHGGLHSQRQQAQQQAGPRGQGRGGGWQGGTGVQRGGRGAALGASPFAVMSQRSWGGGTAVPKPSRDWSSEEEGGSEGE